MKELPLNNGRGFALIDDEDFERVKSYTWYNSNGRVVTVNSWGTFKLHHIILTLPSSVEVDHIDRNPLNNQKYNLRVATHSQNMANRPKQKNNTSGFKGVYRQRGGGWYAQIEVKGKRYHECYCSTAVEAARAYDKLAKHHFGEFAYLNFPDLTA
jgi:hypothetical protein